MSRCLERGQEVLITVKMHTGTESVFPGPTFPASQNTKLSFVASQHYKAPQATRAESEKCTAPTLQLNGMHQTIKRPIMWLRTRVELHLHRKSLAVDLTD
ncbi:unnamed protein product [Pleuronectes platessa]|uniref:Uncharacterized protein n=1 Tax=Pleuronectes platessa TaxID=8262 RepID=A0A9N7VMT1_PLEPL|nr:unnamed protein product [Pleuronectes platessa]